MCLYLSFKYWNTFNNATFKWFWTIFSLGAPDFLCQFASSKKSKNIYSGKDTSIIRWPKRRVTALQIVRTSFLGPRPRLFPPPSTWLGTFVGLKKQLKIKGTRNYYFKTRFYATWPLSLRLSFCGFTGTWPTRNIHSYTYSFFMSSKKTDRDCAFMVAVLKLWSKLPAIPSVTRGNFSPYKWVSLFNYLMYVFLRRSHKNCLYCVRP